MLELIIVLMVVAAVWYYRDPILSFLDRAADEVNEAVDELAEQVEQIEEEVDELKDKIGASVDELKKMTKDKIEEIGRLAGVELDKRKTKANMIDDLKSSVEDKK